MTSNNARKRASGQPMRIVVGARLSQDTDRSTSIERQIEKGRAWATLKGGQVVGEAIDLDVSGGADPWSREGLGPWLRRPQDFDALVFMKIDRMSRSTRDFANLLLWAEENDVLIVATDDGVDLSTDIGQMVAKILSIFSEFELRTITKRIADSQRHLKEQGKWKGGALPYWCETKVGPDGRPAHNDQRSQITREMINKVMSTETPLNPSGVRDWLNEQKHPTMQEIFDKQKGRKKGQVIEFKTKKTTGKRSRTVGKYEWTTPTVLSTLRSPALAGFATDGKDKKIRRDGDDNPVMALEPLISYQEFLDLQKRLDVLSGPSAHKGPHKVSPLRSVVYCGDEGCGHAYHLHAPSTRARATYRCGSNRKSGLKCNSQAIDRNFLESLVSEAVMDRLGHLPRVKTIKVNSGDLPERLTRVRESLTMIRSEYDDGLYDYDGGTEEYRERMRSLTMRLKALQDKEKQVGQEEAVTLGGTFGNWWDSAEWEERRMWLVENHVQVRVTRYAEPYTDLTANVHTRIDWGSLEALEKAARTV